MKKITCILLVVFMCFLALGCNSKKNTENNGDKEEKFVLEKIDSNKDWVYLESYRDLKYSDGNAYNLQNLVINIKSEAVDTINLEINSFVKKSFKDMTIVNGVVQGGNIISYAFYNSEDYISVIQKYHSYLPNQVGEEKNNIYVVSKKTGNNLSNEELLKNYGYTQEEFYKGLENKIDSEDVLYTLMNIKKDGYNLYVDNNNQLVVVYYEVSEDDTIRKELTLG